MALKDLFSDKGINVDTKGGIYLSQSTQNPDQRWLTVQSLENTSPKQFSVTQDQYAQLQNLGLSSSTTFSSAQYMSGALGNISELADIINPLSYKGGDLESKATQLKSAFSSFQPIAGLQ